MARPKNVLKTVKLPISTTQPVVDSLEILVASGLFGKSSPEAAERLIAKGIQELMKEGQFFQNGKNGKSSQKKP
jgi:hypothetical protein